MPLTQTEEKYINRTLADMAERVGLYRKLSISKSRSARDRAIWRALYIEFSRAFNLMLKTLGTIATTKLGLEQRLEISDLLNGKGFSFLTDEELEQILEESFGLSVLERTIQREELERKFAQVLAVTSRTTPQVRKALSVLAKYKALDKFVDIEKLLKEQPPEIKALPRGNTAPQSESDLETEPEKELSIEDALSITEGKQAKNLASDKNHEARLKAIFELD